MLLCVSPIPSRQLRSLEGWQEPGRNSRHDEIGKGSDEIPVSPAPWGQVAAEGGGGWGLGLAANGSARNLSATSSLGRCYKCLFNGHLPYPLGMLSSLRVVLCHTLLPRCCTQDKPHRPWQMDSWPLPPR